MSTQINLHDDRDEAWHQFLQESPIWNLAVQVGADTLTIVEANRFATKLPLPDIRTINRYDTCIRRFAQPDLDLAVALAELKGQLAIRIGDQGVMGKGS